MPSFLLKIKIFFKHKGVDIFSILKASVINIKHVYQGELVGASTITQQVAKNFLLSSEVTMNRKIKRGTFSN